MKYRCGATLAVLVIMAAAAGCRPCDQTLYDSAPSEDPSADLYHAYLWTGPPDVAPECPPGAPTLLFEAYAALGGVAHTCPTCICGPSETTCLPPQGWSAVAAPCTGAANAKETPFDGPNDWAGVCNTATKIAAGVVCSGGVDCVQSVVVEPPQATGAPCAPVRSGEETKPGAPWPWATLARGCAADLDDIYDVDECGDTIYKTRGDYRWCARLEQADDLCPSNLTERHELFQDVSDERACAPCTCGTPEGGDCAVKVGAFSDEACEAPVGSAYVSVNEAPVCFDVPDGTALRGKSAEQAFSTPGSCVPGGGMPAGQVTPAKPVTWCCDASE